MNREELDRLWQTALHESVAAGEQYTRYRFAALVAAAERGACAKLCDDVAAAWSQTTTHISALDCAAAIRARGNT